MNVRNNRGSVTLFVLVGVTFMSAFLLISYANNVNKSKMAKEQFNMISTTYSYNDGDANAYNRAYDALRIKNKQILSASVSLNSTLELTKTFEESLSNYKIYGSTSGLGTLITATSDSNYGKYKIQINITDGDGNTTTSNIYISEPLRKSGTLVDYIDYKNQKVVRQVNSKREEAVTLPVIFTCEDYTKIQVTAGTPSMIEVEYVGYIID